MRVTTNLVPYLVLAGAAVLARAPLAAQPVNTLPADVAAKIDAAIAGVMNKTQVPAARSIERTAAGRNDNGRRWRVNPREAPG